MRRFWRFFDRVTDLMAILAGVIMAFITAAICYGVVMRYFLMSPSIWVVQTCEYALLWMVFLGTTWLLREKGHVGVDIIYSHLKDKRRSCLNVVMFALAGVDFSRTSACCFEPLTGIGFSPLLHHLCKEYFQKLVEKDHLILLKVLKSSSCQLWRKKSSFKRPMVQAEKMF